MNAEVPEEESWDLVIKPKRNLLDLRLDEVWRYRDLLMLWVRREYVGAYKQTILGPAWHFISPIFTALTYMLVFGRIAQLPRDGVPMFLFYNAGITIWNFFAGCFGSSANAFLGNTAIFSKVYFPRLIMPLASMISTLIKFGIQSLLFIVVYILYIIFRDDFHPQLGWALLYIPFVLILLAGIGFGSGIIISSLTTKYRDLNVFVGFGLQLLMFATPVIYSFSSLDPTLKEILKFNPLVPVVECFKYAVFGTGQFSLTGLLYSSTMMIVLAFTGIVLFNRAEQNFMDVV